MSNYNVTRNNASYVLDYANFQFVFIKASIDKLKDKINSDEMTHEESEMWTNKLDGQMRDMELLLLKIQLLDVN